MVAMATRRPADPPVEPASTNGDGAVSRIEPAAPSSWGLGDGAAIPWDYAPAPESRDVVTLKERYGLFIGGKDVAASDGETFATVNPATEEPLALVARATAVDMDKAVRVRGGCRHGRPGRAPGAIEGLG